jgi:tight adherence protein B
VLIPVLLTFIAVFLIVAAVIFGITAAKESPAFALRKRLRRMASNSSDTLLPNNVRSDILKETPHFEQILYKSAMFRKLEQKLDHAGLEISVDRFLIFALMGIILSAVIVYMLFYKALFALMAAICFIIVIAAVLHYRKVQRTEKITEQLPNALMMIARSLRAGHSMNSAIELVGLETPSPLGSLFKTAYDQQKLGLNITDALTGMLERVESLDLRFFVTTISINSDLGGNLSETLDKLAETIRQRFQIRRQVKVYTAQGRLSGYVLACLPIFMFFAIYILNPPYVMLLITEKKGNYMLITAAAMQIVGSLVIRKIINIRI